MSELVFDTRSITPVDLQAAPHSSRLDLERLLPLLRAPDSGGPLMFTQDKNALTDGEVLYPIVGGCPVLYPQDVADLLDGSAEIFAKHIGSRRQYFQISKIKQSGDITAPPSNIHAQRHLFRMSEFTRELAGIVLDVGCDDVFVSSALYTPSCQFVGLDPFCNLGGFRLIGVGEALPCQTESIDNVVFNTSLDHILDYFEGLKEAHRVLKPGGSMVISTLIWTGNSSLLNDDVHFHHFKDFEIIGAIRALNFKVIKQKNFSYKDDINRHGLYITVQK